MPQERLDLGREKKLRRSVHVIQRFDPVAIASEEQLWLRMRTGAITGAAVVNREREHPIESGNTARAPLFVGMQCDFAVGARAKYVSRALELCPQLTEVVDLAVAGDGYVARLVDERLRGRAAQIDDGKTPVAETDGADN